MFAAHILAGSSHPHRSGTAWTLHTIRAILETEQARELLASSIPARLAFTALEGTPRVVPTWFHWTGSELVMGHLHSRQTLGASGGEQCGEPGGQGRCRLADPAGRVIPAWPPFAPVGAYALLAVGLWGRIG